MKTFKGKFNSKMEGRGYNRPEGVFRYKKDESGKQIVQDFPDNNFFRERVLLGEIIVVDDDVDPIPVVEHAKNEIPVVVTKNDDKVVNEASGDES